MLDFRAYAVLATAVLLLGLTSWIFKTSEPEVVDEPEVAPEEEPAVPLLELDAFGIERSRYQVEEKQIRRNQTFSDLLAPYGVSPATIAELADRAEPVFDVRRLRAGRPLHIYTADSTDAAQLVVYEIDRVNYVVFDLQEDIVVERGEREVTTDIRTVEGVIEQSPYLTLVEAGANPHLAVMLSEVFAWQVDFYRIRAGDSFRIVYEERLVDGEPAGLGRILAAEFTHRGTARQAYFFEYGEERGYFDEEGNSLRKAFLRAPLRYQRISSRYSRNRYHPVLKRNMPHLGTDYAAPAGTAVRATGNGTVTEAGYTRGNGNYVKIRHNSVYETQYLHLSRFASGIQRGARVEQGDVIGYVGQTGLATGPHLCYRFWKNGQQVDPYRLEFPSGDPVPEEFRVAFEALRASMQSYLFPGEQPHTVATRASDTGATL